MADTNQFPLRVMFEVTYRCNFHCRHCYVPLRYRKKEGELNTKEVFSLLRQIRDAGCFYLGFTGGEPFMRDDIVAILWHAKKLGFQIMIYSNGSLIDRKMARELSRLDPNKVDITIPAMSTVVFEKITGEKGSWKRVFGAVDVLHKNGVNLGFKTCVLRENEQEIREIQDYAASLGTAVRLDTVLFPRLDGSQKPLRYQGSCDAEHWCADEPLSPSRASLHQKKVLNKEYLFRCGVGRSQVAISPFGKLKMCLMIDYPLYRIGDTSWKDSWEKLKGRVAAIASANSLMCHKCKFGDYCKWCPARGWLAKKDFGACDSESYAWARQCGEYVRNKIAHR